MKTKPNPKLIAAIVSIFALPALVAFAWAEYINQKEEKK